MINHKLFSGPSVHCCLVCVACKGSDVMRCANTDRCIHTSYVCDGHDTCGDWTDELNCGQSTSLDLFTAVHLLRVSPLYYKYTTNGTNGVRELLLTNLQVCRGYGITMEIPVGVGMR